MASKFNMSLLCTVGVVALASASSAYAQEGPVEQVTVTGSRIISDITLSPTPLTVVTAEQLQQTTPTNVPDALNKLPVFIGGRTPRSQDNGSRNTSGNVWRSATSAFRAHLSCWTATAFPPPTRTARSTSTSCPRC